MPGEVLRVNVEINVVNNCFADKPWVQRQGQRAHMLTRAHPLSGINSGLHHVVFSCLVSIRSCPLNWLTFACREEMTSVAHVPAFGVSLCLFFGIELMCSCVMTVCVQALSSRCPSVYHLHIEADQTGHKAYFNSMIVREQTWFQIY